MKIAEGLLLRKQLEAKIRLLEDLKEMYFDLSNNLQYKLIEYAGFPKDLIKEQK